jgi:rod shape-determining protein MreC
VLAINDQTSGAGVILETTRIRGILRGNASGQLQIVGILADNRIQPGEKVFTAGGDLIFPRGLPVGVVQKVVQDPVRDSFIDVMIKPAAHLDQLDEVLVITDTEPRFSDQQQQDLATSEELKGAEAAAINEQKKASAIMAERLPGLTDPNAPAPGLAAGTTANSTLPPGQGQPVPNRTASAANPQQEKPKLLPSLHPDRFTPSAVTEAPADASPDAESRPAETKTVPTTKTGAKAKTDAKTKTGEKP